MRSVTAPVTIANGQVTVPQPPTPPTDPGTGPGTTVTAPVVSSAPASVVGVTNVNLAWSAVTGATKYQVAVSSVNGTAVTALNPQPVPVTGVGTAAPVPAQSIVGLKANTTYRFTVTVTTAAGTATSAAVDLRTTGDTVTITTARYKTTDFRVVGTTSATGGTVSVYASNPNPTTGTPPSAIPGMANVPITSAAPAAGGAFDARLRTGVPARPAQVWVKTSNGAATGPFTVT